jgi:hypothetical protein
MCKKPVGEGANLTTTGGEDTEADIKKSHMVKRVLK